jgi:hypothetical protein
MVIWFMNSDGTRKSAASTLPAAVPPNFRVEAAGDFNGDDQLDLVLRHQTSGLLAFWFMDGANRTGAVNPTPTGLTNTQWKVAAAGDYDRDGKGDIVYQRDDGSVAIWFFDGHTRKSAIAVHGASSDNRWRVVGGGDFDQDGDPDLLYRHTGTGALEVKYLEAGVITGTSPVTPNGLRNVAWAIQAVADFNADGKPDLLYRNTSTGQMAMWFMDGVTRASAVTTTPSALNTMWEIVGAK